MIRNTVAIVLGGILQHISLIRMLKQRGYYTILIDYYKDTLARHVADEHICESTLDQEKVLEIAIKRKASLVISTGIDQANVTACYVSEKLGLPAPYDYNTAISVTNKGIMKDTMVKNGITTSKYVFLKDISEFNSNEFTFPVIVKPADNNSSRGIAKAEDLDELRIVLHKALDMSRIKQAIIEEFIQGIEIGIDCYVQDGKVFILMIKERRKITCLEDEVQQIYGCIWPAALSEKIQEKTQSAANKIAEAFKLDNTPLMIQAIVNKNGLFIIEFGARFGGGESFRIIELSTGFDVINAAINSFLGHPVKVNLTPSKEYYMDNFIYAYEGEFAEVTGKKILIDENVIEYLNVYKPKGTKVSGKLTSNNRIGVFTVKAKSIDGLFIKMKTALEKIEVMDTSGQSMMRKDIYKC